jgi:hypothetical protein
MEAECYRNEAVPIGVDCGMGYVGVMAVQSLHSPALHRRAIITDNDNTIGSVRITSMGQKMARVSASPEVCQWSYPSARHQ